MDFPLVEIPYKDCKADRLQPEVGDREYISHLHLGGGSL